MSGFLAPRLKLPFGPTITAQFTTAMFRLLMHLAGSQSQRGLLGLLQLRLYNYGR
jgi:hypothetical protein